jgi:hypothetical protein
VKTKTPRLALYWYELDPKAPVEIQSGQLVAAMHRLKYLREELAEIARCKSHEMVLRRLTYHVENYFIRAYELRERIVALAARHCDRPSLAGKLKKPSTRAEALQTINGRFPELVEPLNRLLEDLDDDIEIRNLHTHEAFMSIGIYTGDDIFDPFDAGVDLEHEPASRRKLKARIFRLAKDMAREYRAKIRKISAATLEILKLENANFLANRKASRLGDATIP